MSRPEKNGEKYVQQNVSMDPQQLERLATHYQKTDRPTSWVIRQALDKYLDDNAAQWRV